MPSKGKRVATRQGNLRRRRSNANRTNPSEAPPTVTTAESPSTPASVSVGAATTATATTTAAPAVQATGRSQTQPLGRRFDRPSAYNHVRSELVRIGIFSSVLLVVLIAVSFVI